MHLTIRKDVTMEIKRILLIEDCDWHATKTKSLLSELSDMYHVECKVFAFLPQNGQNRNSKYEEIKQYILLQIEKDNFDILMIDMLLGDDSAENPLGLQLIKDLSELLKKKKIFIYTEMSSDELDLIKNYNRSIGNCLKIIVKPDLKVLTNKIDCIGKERKQIMNANNIICKNQRCTYEEKFLCDMKNAYYELED